MATPFESKNSPFVHELKSVTEAMMTSIRQSSLPGFQNYLVRDTAEAVRKVAAEGPHVRIQELSVQLIDGIRGEGHFPAEGLAFLLDLPHPFVERFNDWEKRFILDAALGAEILDLRKGIDDSNREDTYLSVNRTEYDHRGQSEKKIRQYLLFQAKLRQKHPQPE